MTNRRDAIIPCTLLAVFTLALSPYILLAAVLLVLLSALRMARKAARRVRFRAALHLHTPVREDGEPLAGADLTAFTGILRGWDQAAPEPEYDRRPTWDS